LEEKVIEDDVCKYARKKYDALALKFTSPRRKNVPDRIFLFPAGIIVFIEFKATGKLPNEGQIKEMGRLKDRGFKIHVCDDIDQGREMVDHYGEMSRLLS
jgi:hypothetical protein